MKDRDILILYFDDDKKDAALYEAKKIVDTLAVRLKRTFSSIVEITIEYPGNFSNIIIRKIKNANRLRGMGWNKQCYIPKRSSWMSEDEYRDIISYCECKYCNILGE